VPKLKRLQESHPLQESSRARPHVSIGMPVYNCAATVAQAVRSILSQTFEDWELLIIDDGSTDDTLNVVASFNHPRILVVKSERNEGLPTRLNDCVRLARGKYFARMDGDDIAYPERLQKQIAYLENHPLVDLLGAGMVMFRDNGEAYGERRAASSHAAISGNFYSGLNLAHATWMGRTEWFRQNPYRCGFLRAQDRELLMRTRKKSHFAALPEPLFGCREGRVRLRKTIPARYYLCRAYLEDAFLRGHLLYGLGGVVFSVAKFMLDIIAVGTGLQHKLLSHRARPLPDNLRNEWLNVWELTSAATTNHEK
jgi:glycosyltransferase involved in cell wall biosynthesis